MTSDKPKSEERSWGHRYHVENVLVLCFAVAIAVLGVLLSRTGIIFSAGGAMGIGAIYIIKGASRLRCHKSDYLLALTTLALAILSKVPALAKSIRLSCELVAVLLTIMFLLTGLSLRSILAAQKHRTVDHS